MYDQKQDTGYAQPQLRDVTLTALSTVSIYGTSSENVAWYWVILPLNKTTIFFEIFDFYITGIYMSSWSLQCKNFRYIWMWLS